MLFHVCRMCKQAIVVGAVADQKREKAEGKSEPLRGKKICFEIKLWRKFHNSEKNVRN